MGDNVNLWLYWGESDKKEQNSPNLPCRSQIPHILESCRVISQVKQNGPGGGGDMRERTHAHTHTHCRNASYLHFIYFDILTLQNETTPLVRNLGNRLVLPSDASSHSRRWESPATRLRKPQNSQQITSFSDISHKPTLTDKLCMYFTYCGQWVHRLEIVLRTK
jgi:hypothetical protein